ncbi:MAG: hypothetical protein AAFP19_16450, partial [Bacteroidota bacterium]
MRNYFFLFLLGLCMLTVTSVAQAPDTSVLSTTIPPAKIDLPNYTLSVQSEEGKARLLFQADRSLEGRAQVSIDGEEQTLDFVNGQASFDTEANEEGQLMNIQGGGEESGLQLFHLSKTSEGSYRLRSIPLWLSILPPLVAILLALLFKEVIVSLFIGIWTGAFIACGLRIDCLFYSLLKVIEKYIIGALNVLHHL